MMNTFLIDGIAFLLSLLLWIIIPHFVVGVPCVLILLALMVGFVCFFRRSKIDTGWNISKQQVVKINSICLYLSAIACISLLFVVPSLLIFVKIKRKIFTVAFFCYALIWFFVMCCDIVVSHSEHKMHFKRRKLSGLSGVALWVLAMAVMQTVLFGLEESILVIIIPLCLAVITVSFISNQVLTPSLRWSELDNMMLSSVVAAFLLFFVLNTELDMTEELVRYQLKPGTSSTCVIENGRTFLFKNCPISEGTYGWLNEHQGWFNIQYVTRLYEE